MKQQKKLNRRTFIELLGKGSISLSLLPYFISCADIKTENKNGKTIDFKITGIEPSLNDELILAEGLAFHSILKWGDQISKKDYFGFNNDFLCFFPIDDKDDEGILWVNHEYLNDTFIHKGPIVKTKADSELDLYNVGGSLVHIKLTKNKWELVYDSKYNRRVSGLTQIPFNWDHEIEGANSGMGTLGNCAGGITPWGTVLTCEENYPSFYGERKSYSRNISPSNYQCEKHFKNPPEHYGWVVEVNPFTGSAKKHIGLGRCAHECATVKKLDDERVVVYTGDDGNNEHLYKFISSSKNSLDKGSLYVANIEKGEWIPVDIEQHDVLKNKFNSQTEVLIYLREAAKLIGASELDRPEDIEIDPVTGNVLVALTNNVTKGNYFGSILKIEEEGGRHESLTFKSETYLAGGEETGFAAPDNMVFDRAGNLWFTSDISGSSVNKPPYEMFKNNGLFVVPREGIDKGKVIQLASAPVDAEFTGPWFSPDSKTLFLSVQHPGEKSKSINELTSNWPDGENNIPKPTVVAINGELLNKIQGIT